MNPSDFINNVRTLFAADTPEYSFMFSCVLIRNKSSDLFISNLYTEDTPEAIEIATTSASEVILNEVTSEDDYTGLVLGLVHHSDLRVARNISQHIYDNSDITPHEFVYFFATDYQGWEEIVEDKEGIVEQENLTDLQLAFLSGQIS